MNCIQLESLDISNFDTSLVTQMHYMFSNCKHLGSLNLFNFKTSLVTDMQYMFYNCSKLLSLDISNFDTSEVTNSQEMFYGLNSIMYINLYNAKDNNQLKSALSQLLNDNIDHNIIICQSQIILNNVNAITTCEFNNYIIAK